MNTEIIKCNVDELNLSVRSANALKREGIFTVEKILELDENYLKSIKNLGQKSIKEILDLIAAIKCGNNDAFIIKENTVKDVRKINKTDLLITYVYNDKRITLGDITFCIDGLIVDDIDFTEIPLSNRLRNVLNRNEIFNLSSLCRLKMNDLISFKNIGQGSINEAIDIVKQYTALVVPGEREINSDILEYFSEAFSKTYFADNIKIIKANVRRIMLYESNSDFFSRYENPKDYIDKLNELIIADEFFENMFKNQIISFSKLDNGTDYHQMSMLFYKDISKYIDVFINNLLRTNSIENIDGRYYYIYPSVIDVIPMICDEDQTDLLLSRLRGETLDEIGQGLNLTRERVRQKLVKIFAKFPPCREDRYKKLFQKYDLNKDDFCHFFGESEASFYYLNTRYKSGYDNIENLIEDESFPLKYRIVAERIAYKNYVNYSGKYIRKRKSELIDFAIAEFCQETIRFNDFVDLYNMFVDESFMIPINSNSQRGLENRIADSKMVLWKYPKSMRYYDIETNDYTEMLEALNLSQYSDVELSTAKFFNENSDIMELYDIRDEYELHNLLKKICNAEFCSNMIFSRMPNIEFGTVDREKQVATLLFELAPIKQTEFIKAYSEAYGIPQQTVTANYLQYISEYLMHGEYAVHLNTFDKTEAQYMESVLTNDIYSVEKLKKIYTSEFQTGDISKINSVSMSQIGFTMYSGYVLSKKYKRPYDYFKKCIIENELFSFDYFEESLRNLPSLHNCIGELKADFSILEYSFRKFISAERLKRVSGTTEQDLKEYISEALKAANGDYFTIASLRFNGFEHKLDDLGFDDYFYSSLISADSSVRFWKTGGNIILKQTEKQFLLEDFIEWYVYSKEKLSVEMDELIDELELMYHVYTDKWKVLDTVKNTKLYYNAITNTLYADYDVYFDEI